MYRTDRKPILYQGEVNFYDSDKDIKFQENILYYIKENGLTISQATEILKNIIDILPNYGTLITDAEYEQLTGRDPGKWD